MPTNFSTEVNEALAQAFSRLRDTSVRDGQQSWDANRWRIEDILPVLERMDALAVMLRDQYGHELAPVEVWGGGQVAQPAKFNGENPFANLRAMRQAAPNLVFQDLYRGRQGYGFEPVSEEVQMAATLAAKKSGIKVHRVFDMMNDIENLTIGIMAGKAAGMIVEGGISYVSEPDGKRAWSFEDYANFAVNLAEHGCDEIVIKDYAGLLQDPAETQELIAAIRGRLATAGYPNIPLNLHSHGQKPDVLKAAMDAGCHKVDVAVGDLSEGSSHTNIRSMIELMMQEQGFEPKDYAGHPLMQQLDGVEYAINQAAKKHVPHRIPQADQPSPEEIARYRIAGGAISAQWTMIAKDYDKLCHGWKMRGVDKRLAEQGKTLPTENELFRRHLELMPQLWEAAGRFNTVTPGALILAQEALLWALEEVEGRTPPSLGSRTQAYKDVVMGRYGKNQGMDRGIGDTDMLNQFLLENMAFAILKLKDQQVCHDLLEAAGFADEVGFERSRLRAQIEAMPPDAVRNVLERLRDIAASPHYITDEVLRQQIEAAGRPGRFPMPTQTLAEFQEAVQEWPIETANGKRMVNELARSGELPVPVEEITLLAALLNTKTTGPVLTQNLLKTLVTGTPHGNVEQDRFKDVAQTLHHTVLRRCATGDERAAQQAVGQLRENGYPDDGLPVNSAERLTRAAATAGKSLMKLKSGINPEDVLRNMRESSGAAWVRAG